MNDLDKLQLRLVIAAHKSVTAMNHHGNGRIGGMRFAALRASHEGRTHYFLFRYTDVSSRYDWNVEFRETWSGEGILVKFTGDYAAYAKDAALLRMFLSVD